MSDIQKARDILAKRRWGLNTYGPAAVDLIADGTLDDRDAPIVAIMTDPDLLDAIDGLLITAERYDTGNGLRIWSDRIAAAIIAAAERMNS